MALEMAHALAREVRENEPMSNIASGSPIEKGVFQGMC